MEAKKENAAEKRQAEITRLMSLTPRELSDLALSDMQVAILCVSDPGLARIEYDSFKMAMWAAMSFPEAAAVAIGNPEIAKLPDSEGRYTVAHVAAFSFSSISEVLINNVKGLFDQILREIPGLRDSVEAWTKAYDLRVHMGVSDLDCVTARARPNPETVALFMLNLGHIYGDKFMENGSNITLFKALRSYRIAKNIASECGNDSVSWDAKDGFQSLREAARDRLT